MGFFSSIGKVFKKVAAPVAGVLGTALGGPAAGVAGAAMADAVWGGSDSGSDWQKSAYNDQMNLARQQFDFNKQYVQNQLQWRVADAQKAGLHPMAALGINGASFSGVSMPSIPNISDSTFDPVELGQSAAYAATKAKTAKQQEQAFALSQSLAGEQIKGVQLDNELKQLEIMSLVSRMTQTGPAAPTLDGRLPGVIEGQNDSDVDPKALVDPKAMRTTPHKEPGKEPGSNPSTGWIQNPDGSVTAVHSESAKERLEEDLIGSSIWTLNNRVLPHIKTMLGLPAGVSVPPDDLLPKGAVRWMYNGYGSFIPVDSHGKRVGGPPQVNSDKALRKYVRDFPKRHFGRFGVKY